MKQIMAIMLGLVALLVLGIGGQRLLGSFSGMQQSTETKSLRAALNEVDGVVSSTRPSATEVAKEATKEGIKVFGSEEYAFNALIFVMLLCSGTASWLAARISKREEQLAKYSQRSLKYVDGVDPVMRAGLSACLVCIALGTLGWGGWQVWSVVTGRGRWGVTVTLSQVLQMSGILLISGYAFWRWVLGKKGPPVAEKLAALKKAPPPEKTAFYIGMPTMGPGLAPKAARKPVEY